MSGAPLRRLWLVGTSRGNLFMNEILEGLADALRDQGTQADVVLDRFPEVDADTGYAVIPHEFFDTTPEESWPSDEQLRRTVAICTEQPGTPWFEISHDHARRCGAVMDINRVGLLELRRRGIPAQHLQLGYLAAWDFWQGDPTSDRPIDVLFLGSSNRRRDELLAHYAPALWHHRTRLVVAGHEPKQRPGPDFVVGDDKRRLLSQAKIVISPRRQAEPYFEWVRALEAMSNGAVLVCDHAAGAAPLVSGEHFVSGTGETLGLLADALLRDPERLAAVRDHAYSTIRQALPAAAGAQRLAEVAADLVSSREREVPPPPARREPEQPVELATQGLRADLKRAALELIALRRDVTEASQPGTPAAPLLEYRSPAANGGTPRVSICIPAYDGAAVIGETLASVAVQDEPAIELVVLDDGSGDDTLTVVSEFMTARPWLAATLLRHRLNRGLPRARNALAQAARGPYVLMLDADNELYPPAARRLADALDADPDALFAYPVLQDHDGECAVALRSYRAWDPSLFRSHNPIDALALLRRERLLELGGYSEDLSLYGWEDFELWIRAAERGEHGVHVAEILARYRRRAGSMLAVTDIDTTALWGTLRDRFPRTMAGVS